MLTLYEIDGTDVMPDTMHFELNDTFENVHELMANFVLNIADAGLTDLEFYNDHRLKINLKCTIKEYMDYNPNGVVYFKVQRNRL